MVAGNMTGQRLALEPPACARFERPLSTQLSPRPSLQLTVFPPPVLAVDWYLQRVGQAVEAAKRATDGAPLTLLAHSAGGWLGRWVGQAHPQLGWLWGGWAGVSSFARSRAAATPCHVITPLCMPPTRRRRVADFGRTDINQLVLPPPPQVPTLPQFPTLPTPHAPSPCSAAGCTCWTSTAPASTSL